MSGRIRRLEEAINSLIEATTAEAELREETDLSYAEVLDVEVPPAYFPASTLLFSFPSQTDYATGGLTENEWRWVQRSYFDNTDPALAQSEMKRLLPALLTTFRRNPVLTLPDGTTAEIDVEDTGPPEPAEGRGMPPVLVKSLEIVMRTEED